MFVLIVELEAKPSLVEQLATLLKSMTDVAATEPGIHFYAVHRPEGRPNAFVLYELYQNTSAWETHVQIPAIQTALAQFGALLAHEPRITRCETVCTTPMGITPGATSEPAVATCS